MIFNRLKMFELSNGLTVIVCLCAFLYIPGLLSLHDEEEKKVTHLTASIGESVVFTCPLDFPYDIPIPYILHWYKDGKNVYSLYEGTLQSPTDNYKHRINLMSPISSQDKISMNLTNVRETDAGWYECKVTFPNRTPSSRPNGTWFRLTVDGGNLLTVPPTNQSVMEGESAHLTCVTKDKEAVVSWFKDGVALSELHELSERSWVGPEGSLTIRSTNMDDLGHYTCEVVNRKQERQSAGAYLNVQYKAKIVYSPRELYLPYGRPALLDCHFRANPPLTTLRWEKDGFLFDPFNVQGVFYRRNGSLYFSKVDETHAGDYTCTPYNDLGTDGPSPPIHVVVQRPPVFTVTPHNVYLRKTGDSIEMPCDALDGDGTHRPTIVWFKKDGTPLPAGRASVVGGNLTLSNIEENDRGKYQCVASNEAATITSETELMIENSVPRAPYNLTAETTANSVTVRWVSGFNRPNLEYSVWYRPTDVPEWRTLRIQSKGTTEATVPDLSPGREYELMVLSQDQHGDGMFSKALKVRTKGTTTTTTTTTETASEPQEFRSPIVETFPSVEVSSPRNVHVDLTANGYLITWDPPELGAHAVQKYQIRWFREGGEQFLEKGETKQHSYTIPNLEEESTYLIQVIAHSNGDYEAESNIVTLQIPAYKKTRAITIGMVLGIGLVLAAICVAWYAHRFFGFSKHKSAHIDDS